MNVTFHAKSVVFEHPEQECFLVGFADEKYNPKQYLLLQRDFELDAQNRDWANKYYVEWCSQKNSGYGGVRQFSVHRNYIEFQFAPDTTEKLNGIAGANITFHIDDAEFDILRQRLKGIFQGSDCQLILNT